VHQAGKLSEELRAHGAEPVEVPVLEIRPPENLDALDWALQRLGSYDWLIVTSANAVRALTERAAAIRIPLDQLAPPQLHVAAIANATAMAAKMAGFPVALVPDDYVAESLVVALAPRVCRRRVMLARAAIARDIIPDALRAAGANLDVVDVYRNVMPADAPNLLSKALAKGIDAATFTSSSSVTHLANAAKEGGIEWPFRGVAAISIGPITSATLVDAGWVPAQEAMVSDLPGLVEAAIAHFAAG